MSSQQNQTEFVEARSLDKLGMTVGGVFGMVDGKSLREQVKLAVFCLGLLAFFAFGVIAPQWYFLVIVVGLVLVLLARWPMVGLVAMAVSAPFINVQARWGNVNVPVVDVVAMTMIAAVVLRWAFFSLGSEHQKNTTLHYSARADRYKVLVFSFTLFLGAAMLSLPNAPEVWQSIKYLLRPMLFFAIAYLAVPLVVLQGSSRPSNAQGSTFSPSRSNLNRHVTAMLWGFVAVGVTVTVMGLFSLLGQEDVAVRRVLPIPIFGMYPLGTNQNQIAEVLLVTLPVMALLRERVQTVLARRLWVLAMAPVAFTLLATLSRAGWIAFAVEVAIVLALIVRPTVKQIVIGAMLTSILVFPFLGPFVRLASIEAGASANENRWLLTQAAVGLWKEHPWVGNGPGTFVPLLSQDRRYVAKFGEALDSHGVVQKLLVETGLLGLGTFIFFWLSLLLTFWYSYKQSKLPVTSYQLPVTALWFALFLGTSVFQLFGTSYFLGRFWLPIGVGLAALWLRNYKNTTNTTNASGVRSIRSQFVGS